MVGLVLTLAAFYFYLQPAKRYIAVFLIFVIVTAFFQLLPVSFIELPAAGINKSYDWILIFCGMMLLFRPLVFLRLSLWKKNLNITIFLVVLIILLFYSIHTVGVEVPVAIRVFRNYLFVLTFFLFIPLNVEDFKKVFVLIIYSTSLASLVYCLQPIVKMTMLSGIVNQDTVLTLESGLPRYYNLPTYVLPVIFFFFFSKGLFNLKYYSFLAFINLLAIVLSQHRSLLLTLIFLFVLNLLLEKKIQLIRLLFYAIIGIGFFMFVDNFLGGRFTSGFKDLSEANIKISDIKYIKADELPLLSTSEFRQYHFIERLLYVLKKPDRALFGIGLATEDSKIAGTLSFTVGTTDEDNSDVPQIATGDIAWSLLILNLGLLGTGTFIYFCLSFFSRFNTLKKNNLFKIGMYFIIYLLITSFYGALIIQPYTLCLLMLFAADAYQQQIANNEDEYAYETA